MNAPIPILTIQPLNTRGGPSIQHLHFIGALDRTRFRVHALVSENNPMLAEYRAAADSVDTLADLPTLPPQPGRVPAYLARLPRLVRDVARTAARRDAEVLWVFNSAFPAGPLAARRLGVPAVVHFIGMRAFEVPGVRTVWPRLIGRWSDHLIGCQDVIVDLLAGVGVPRDRLTVVYNSVDTDDVRAEAARRPPPELAEGTLHVGVVGGIDPRKGQHNVVEAAALLAGELPGLRVYLVGSTAGQPAYIGEIERAIASHGLGDVVRLVGEVDSAIAWTNALDILCVPSSTEALPVAGLEAMALGKPIIATAVGGNPVAVADGETGLLCPPDDPAALAGCILRLAADPDRRAAMGAAGRERAERMFRLAPNAAVLADVLGSVRRAGWEA